jgi:starvation-inducible DNA-binding protein
VRQIPWADARCTHIRSRVNIRYLLEITDGMAHVEAVARALSTFGREARVIMEETDKMGDAGNAGIFIETSPGVDK